MLAALLSSLGGVAAPPAAAQPAPRITSVTPDSVTGAVTDQWIAINGSGFAPGFTVRLRSAGIDAFIDDRPSLDFVSARRVRVEANVGTEAASWTVRVANPDSAQTAAHRFVVAAPVPHVEVMRPVERVAGQPGFVLTLYGGTLTSYSVVRWNGKALDTTPIGSSDNKNALTVGLKVKVPVDLVAKAGVNAVRVYTPSPGGGLSTPKTLFVNPRAFYQTPWFYLSLLAAFTGIGFGVHRWRLKNFRQETLEQKVEHRTQQLQSEKQKTEQQADRLRELDEAKRRFFANLSHELRTPLTMIGAPLRDLLSNGALPDGARAPLEAAVRNADRLEHLVDQLLHLTRLEAGRLTLEPCAGDLVGFARGVVRSFAPLAERRGLDLRFRPARERLPMAFDPEKLRTVLSNLLSNALKFTPAGGKVLVRVDAAGETATLRVADTGPGIPEGEQPHIFDRFHQADDSTTRSHEGVGIGLALAKELVELHGGAIRAESEPGLGATFTVTLPIRKQNGEEAPMATTGDAAPQHSKGQAAAEEESLEAAPSSGTERLLIVEDHDDTRAFLRQRLAQRYRIAEAKNGVEALEEIRAERPALVLSDVMMPRMGGAELCRHLKADDDLSDVPVILLTARAGEAAQLEGLDAGADAYVEKPFVMDTLCARIENLIASRNALRDRYRGEVVVEPTGVAVTSEAETFYEAVRAIVEDHIGDRGFDVAMLAAETPGVQSKSQLTRRLKTATGLTPGAFIRRMRLEHAAHLLEADGALRVYEVAGKVGYRDAGHFSKRFREQHGVPPSQYPPPSDNQEEEDESNAASSASDGDTT